MELVIKQGEIYKLRVYSHSIAIAIARLGKNATQNTIHRAISIPITLSKCT
jgi:hypothetical protein